MNHVHGGNIYEYEGCLDFSANLNPLGLPEAVRRAVIDSLDQATLYPEVGYLPLKKAIAAYDGVDADQVICGNGAAEVIYTLCRAWKPRKAVLPAPTFAEYQQALESVDCEITQVYLEADKEYCLDEAFLEATFLQAITEDTDIVFICNPNNPTGILTEREVLIRILKRCQQVNALLVVDECFLDFVKNPQDYTLVNLLNQTDHLFLLKAFTKRYAMAGIRLGYGLSGNQQLLAEMNRMVQPWNISVMAKAAGIAALKETEYVECGRQMVFRESIYLREEMEKMGLHVLPGQANYLFFTAGEDFFHKCAEEGILIRDCSNYQGLEKGCYRIAIKTHEENQKLIHVFRKLLA